MTSLYTRQQRAQNLADLFEGAGPVLGVGGSLLGFLFFDAFADQLLFAGFCWAGFIASIPLAAHFNQKAARLHANWRAQHPSVR